MNLCSVALEFESTIAVWKCQFPYKSKTELTCGPPETEMDNYAEITRIGINWLVFLKRWINSLSGFLIRVNKHQLPFCTAKRAHGVMSRSGNSRGIRGFAQWDELKLQGHFINLFQNELLYPLQQQWDINSILSPCDRQASNWSRNKGSSAVDEALSGVPLVVLTMGHDFDNGFNKYSICS